jgi:hypothetical protein
VQVRVEVIVGVAVGVRVEVGIRVKVAVNAGSGVGAGLVWAQTRPGTQNTAPMNKRPMNFTGLLRIS